MKFLEKWNRVWMAVTFAEANEPKIAKELIHPKKPIKKRARVYA